MKVEIKEGSISSSSSCTSTPKPRIPLIRQLDIPIEQLDYNYVEKCTNVRNIEKILTVLRSGEEGHYPDLEQLVENRLRNFDPKNKLLRKEIPILTKASLSNSEVQSIEEDISNWIDEVEKNENLSDLDKNGIEDSDENDDLNQIFLAKSLKKPLKSADMLKQVPVRGVELVPSVDISKFCKEDNKLDDNFLKKRNPDHIKSWEYDKWNKFNVDAELTKLEIEEMKEEEERNIQKQKLANELKKEEAKQIEEQKLEAEKTNTCVTDSGLRKSIDTESLAF